MNTLRKWGFVMQGPEELFDIIHSTRPTVPDALIHEWVYYLSQLKGCKLFSAAAQEENPDGWLRARTHGIGGSDIATILDENPWSSPRKIWMSKLNMFEGDKQPIQSEAARWGNLLETTIATEWGRRHNRQWIHIPVTIQSEENPWMLANVDGFTLSDDRQLVTGILEVKSTSAYNEEPWSEGPLPFYYMCQTNWYCGICGLDMYCITCLVGGQKLYAYNDMPADYDLFKREAAAAADFWQNNVLKGIEPKAAEADVAALQATEHDPEEPPVILDDEESSNVIQSYVDLRDKITQLEKVKKALYAQLFVYMGKSCSAVIGEHTVALKVTNRRNTDLSKLAREFPEAYAACVSTTASTSLNIR